MTVKEEKAKAQRAGELARVKEAAAVAREVRGLGVAPKPRPNSPIRRTLDVFRPLGRPTQGAHPTGKGAEPKGGMARSWREFRGDGVDQQRGQDALGRQGAPAFRSRSVSGRRHPSAAGVDGRRDGEVSQNGRMGASEEATTRIPSVPGAEAGDEQVASCDGLPLAERALREVAVQDGDPQEAASAAKPND